MYWEAVKRAWHAKMYDLYSSMGSLGMLPANSSCYTSFFCQALMVLGAAMSSTPWACQRRLSWCHTSVRPSWSMGAWRCWLGSAWWHLTLSACLVRSSPSRLCQCPSMPMMLSLAPLEWMLKCCSGWALWSCAVPRRSLSGTPWRLLVTTASLASSPVMRRVRRRCAQLSWRTAAWPWWHLQVLWLRLPSHATRSHGSSEREDEPL